MGVIFLFIMTYVLSHISGNMTLLYVFKVAFSILSSSSFAILIVLLLQKVQISNFVCDFIGVNSLCFYLSHLFFLQFSKIASVYLYVLLVVLGCLIMTLLFIFSKKIMGFNQTKNA